MQPDPCTAPPWDDGPWPPLPALKRQVTCDVGVVGLGSSGLAAVVELLAAGRSVVGVDAGVVGAGASGRNGGFLLAGGADFYHRLIVRLGRARAASLYRLTVAEIDRIAAETPDAVRRTGSLRLASDADELADCQAQLAALAADGLPAAAYEGPEGRGLLLPTDATVQPLARCQTLARRALAAGARLYERSLALTVRGGQVTTPGGRVRCERVVVAVDGGLERLLPELRPRVRSARAQMLATAPALELRLPRPVYARWGWDYWQQLPDGRVVLGGFRDRGGQAEWTTQARPTTPVQAELERFVRAGLGVRAAVTHRWAGTIAVTADRLPVLAEARPGVWAAGAYSGTGNVLGALCGRAASQLATSGRSPLAEILPAG
ncbi:MAG TPA: FAD-binding oxidoreductase [Egibacteraceae bacterium]|nr:FAD-binding oxidoreductase [Egibacteraceae bacterium]